MYVEVRDNFSKSVLSTVGPRDRIQVIRLVWHVLLHRVTVWFGFVVRGRLSLHISGRSETGYISQNGLTLTEVCLPLFPMCHRYSPFEHIKNCSGSWVEVAHALIPVPGRLRIVDSVNLDYIVRHYLKTKN